MEALVKEQVEKEEGGGWGAVKQGLPEALGSEVAAHLGLTWPLEVEDTPLKGALRDWVAQLGPALANIRANYTKADNGGSKRKEGDFVVFLRPGERALHAHRLLTEFLDKALSHASGRSYKG